jgi:RHS repeat-associated protein
LVSATTETKALLTNVFNPWRYTGQYQDITTGLYKIEARYYQPELGRWTQPDPSGQDANAYLHVAASPVNLVDPSGEFPSVISIFIQIYKRTISKWAKEGSYPSTPDGKLERRSD